MLQNYLTVCHIYIWSLGAHFILGMPLKLRKSHSIRLNKWQQVSYN